MSFHDDLFLDDEFGEGDPGGGCLALVIAFVVGALLMLGVLGGLMLLGG